MSNSFAVASSPPPLKGMLLFALLTLAGLAGNHYTFTFFLDIHFLFGTVFALLALQLMGLGKGIAAGGLIAAYTCLRYGHPYAMLIMAAEVAVVGILVLRRNMGMVLADTCYWLVMGIPATYLFYHLMLHLPLGTTTITMAKMTVNGITNALIARMFFMGYAVYSRCTTLSYREIVHNLFSFFVLFPSLIILAASSRSDFRQTDRTIRTSLNQDSQRIDKMMDIWVLNRKQGLTALADALATTPPREVGSYLALATESDNNFKQISLMDKEGEVISFYPPPKAGESSNVGLNLADRHYLPPLRQTLAPMLSEVSFIWSDIPRPRVALLAPVIKQGRFAGYVCGVIGLQQTRMLLDKFTEHTEKLYTLTDKHGKIIMTNRPEQEDRKLPPPEDAAQRFDELLSNWMRIRLSGIGSPGGPAVPSYVSEIVVGDLAEWKLTLEQPVAPFQKALYESYTGKLTLLLLVLVGSLGLAEILSRRLMANLEMLLQVTRALPERLASGSAVNWPETSVSEAIYLIRNFREMADSFQDQFHEIRTVNEARAQQSALLKESEEKYRLLFDSANDAMFITDAEGRILEANPQAVERLGFSYHELTTMTVDEIEAEEVPHREERQGRLLLRKALTFETLHKGKDGSLIPTEVSARLILWGHRSVVLSICRDITERKQAYQARLIAMQDLISAIAHQWRQPLATLGMMVQRTHALGSLQGLTPEYLNEFKASAMRQIRYMSDTIEEFRNFYRPDKQRCRFSPESCVEEALQLLEAQLTHHSITVRLKPGGETPHLVEGVPNEFKQVILNLLGNARDAIQESRRQSGSPREGVIDIRVESSQPGYIAIEVGDNGCGIPEESVSKLFTPHFTTKKEQGGTGIGLYMSKMIIEESMGGTLSFKQGSEAATFRIELPKGEAS